MKRYLYTVLWLFSTAVITTVFSCKSQDDLGSSPYENNKNSFGVSFTSNFPNPEIAEPGDLVDFEVKGIGKYIDELEFQINNVNVEVVEAYDSLITVRIPQLVTSGESKIIIGNQVFYGPRLTIAGNVSFDENFGTVNGYNSSVTDILPHNGGFIVTGNFTNFNNEAVEEGNAKTYRRGIHYINAEGKTSTSLEFANQKGAGGISSIDRLSGGGFVIGGNLISFNDRDVLGIATLLPTGRLDTTELMVINTTENAKNGFDTVATFNGGVQGGTILRVFGDSEDRIIAVGTFTRYVTIDYDYSSRDTRRYLYKNVRNIARFNRDGSLDDTYMIENTGANGPVYDAVKVDNDKVVLVGRFTSFNGVAAPGIVRINTDGTVDNSFQVGTGAIQINSITYNASLKKYAVVGNFQKFNNKDVRDMVLLNDNGTIDETFVLRDIGSEVPTFAQILNNGRVVVNGTFLTYDNINRSRLLILESTGELLQKYNNASPFVGSVRRVIESTSALGEPALIFGGSISQFSTKKIGNLFKLEVID